MDHSLDSTQHQVTRCHRAACTHLCHTQRFGVGGLSCVALVQRAKQNIKAERDAKVKGTATTAPATPPAIASPNPSPPSAASTTMNLAMLLLVKLSGGG